MDPNNADTESDPESYPTRWAEAIDRILKINHWKPPTIAKILGYSDSSIYTWLDGTHTPHESIRPQIAEMSGLSLAYLEGDTDDPTPVTGDTLEHDPLSVEVKVISPYCETCTNCELRQREFDTITGSVAINLRNQDDKTLIRYAFYTHDHAMDPEIRYGSLVIYDTMKTPGVTEHGLTPHLEGLPVVICLKEKEIMVRRVFTQDQAKIKLVATNPNPAFQSKVYDHTEVRIFGPVFQVIRNY